MRRLAATSLRRNVACRLVLLLSGSYEEFQHPKRVIRTVKKMTDMRRFIIDKMPPHFFYPPLFWPHTITGGALSHPSAGPSAPSKAVMRNVAGLRRFPVRG